MNPVLRTAVPFNEKEAANWVSCLDCLEDPLRHATSPGPVFASTYLNFLYAATQDNLIVGINSPARPQKSEVRAFVQIKSFIMDDCYYVCRHPLGTELWYRLTERESFWWPNKPSSGLWTGQGDFLPDSDDRRHFHCHTVFCSVWTLSGG